MLDLHSGSLWEFTSILITQVQEQHRPRVLPRHPAPPWLRDSCLSQEVKAHLASLRLPSGAKQTDALKTQFRHTLEENAGLCFKVQEEKQSVFNAAV